MALVISADEIKKQLPNYSPEKAEIFHEESARLADEQFEKEVDESDFNEVILLCGGSASGKSEFLYSKLINENYIIFDGTLSSIKRAEDKIKKIMKAKKKPVIYGVIPDDLRRAFDAFLGRDRKFRDSHFYRTHSSSRKTLLKIVQKYPNIMVNLIESFYSEQQSLQFENLLFNNRQQLIRYLADIQKTKSDIITIIQSTL